LRTDRPTAEVAALMQRFEGEVPELEVRRPSLEDIYLELIGKATTTADLEAAVAIEAGAL
jgi:ABC-2 type transport system ATP-binding protein